MDFGSSEEQELPRSDRASPVHFVGAGDPPLLIIHGERDPVVNPQQAVQLQAAYEEQRLHVSLEMLQGIGHHDLKLNVAPLSKRIESFLTEHLTGSRDAGSSTIAPEG